MKKAFPLSLEEDMIEWIKTEVSKGNFRNRSHLVEQAVKDFKNRVDSGTLKKYV
jgi:Arc/MetJ-type ribon-helix-helix transcriptional regulator